MNESMDEIEVTFTQVSGWRYAAHVLGWWLAYVWNGVLRRCGAVRRGDEVDSEVKYVEYWRF